MAIDKCVWVRGGSVVLLGVTVGRISKCMSDGRLFMVGILHVVREDTIIYGPGLVVYVTDTHFAKETAALQYSAMDYVYVPTSTACNSRDPLQRFSYGAFNLTAT